MGYKSNNINSMVGREVILTEDKRSVAGEFEKGSLVTITSVDCSRGYTFEDDVGNRVIEAGFAGFRLPFN